MNKAIDRSADLITYYKNLAINRFTWEGLPVGLTSERLELMLISHGELMAIEEKGLGVIILPCFGDTKLNIYGLPTNYTLYAENGKLHKRVSFDDGVLLKNNPMSAEEVSTLTIFAERINNVEKTQDVNLFQQNIPKILLADEENKLTLKNLVNKVMEFKFVILGRKSLSKMVNSSDVLDTSAPFLLEDLQKYKESLKNELLTYLGINNNNVEKKERLLVDEVNANNDFTTINIDLMLDMREKFCKEVNSKFGTNISVKKREVEINANNTTHINSERYDR